MATPGMRPVYRVEKAVVARTSARWFDGMTSGRTAEGDAPVVDAATKYGRYP